MSDTITLFFRQPPHRLPLPTYNEHLGPWLLELDGADGIPVYTAQINSSAARQLVAMAVENKDIILPPPVDWYTLPAETLARITHEHRSQSRHLYLTVDALVLKRTNELFLPSDFNADGAMSWQEVALERDRRRWATFPPRDDDEEGWERVMEGWVLERVMLPILQWDDSWILPVTKDHRNKLGLESPYDPYDSDEDRFPLPSPSIGVVQPRSRSTVLADRIWELSDIIGYIAEFSGDQLGSKHILTKLETSPKAFGVRNRGHSPQHASALDRCLCQLCHPKFFEQGNQLQKTAMANVLEGHVLQLSLQMYGCRVVQKALEYVLVDQQVRLVKELDGHVLKCARDAQSNHVVQRALERVPSDKITFITDACVGQVHALATHPYGCLVLQRIFENCPSSQTRSLLEELHGYTQNLIQDQYGNYVIQWVIEKGEKADRSLVISKIYGQVLPLAQQKFASNVIEKCVLPADDEERKHMVEEVLALGPDGSSVVKGMLVHPYANCGMRTLAVGFRRSPHSISRPSAEHIRSPSSPAAYLDYSSSLQSVEIAQ